MRHNHVDTAETKRQPETYFQAASLYADLGKHTADIAPTNPAIATAINTIPIPPSHRPPTFRPPRSPQSPYPLPERRNTARL